MIFKKRVAASIAFAWTLAAAGTPAFALSIGPDGSSDVSLEDVQVGERGNQTRIALICDAPCFVEKLGAREFLLRGVDTTLNLDLSERTQNVSGLRATSSAEGALLSIATVGVIEYANTKNCTVGGRPAACIDLFFNASEIAQVVDVQPVAEQQVIATPKQVEQPILREPKIASKTHVVAKPALRESAPERMMVFAKLTPPERLSPPTGAILAKVQPLESQVKIEPPATRRQVEIKRPAVREPILATVQALDPVARFDYASKIGDLLEKQLTSSHCATAEATLRADAWALRAMVDVGLCAAARGNAEEADAILARLLEYTPDNYEALVGRALIALEAEEKSVARKYFQDALNALPPIEESNRIAEAMNAF